MSVERPPDVHPYAHVPVRRATLLMGLEPLTPPACACAGEIEEGMKPDDGEEQQQAGKYDYQVQHYPPAGDALQSPLAAFLRTKKVRTLTEAPFMNSKVHAANA